MSRKETFEGKTLEHVADVMSGSQAASDTDQMARSEFLLRQTKLQKDAAEAAKETAKYTKRYTRYMFWSVVVLALSALGSFLIALVKFLNN